MYPEFLKLAKEEGNKAVIRTFKYALDAEKIYTILYIEALKNVDQIEKYSSNYAQFVEILKNIFQINELNTKKIMH